jgi:regulatory protein
MRTKNPTPSDNFAFNLNRTLRFLSIRPRSEKEIRDYFKIKNQKSKIKIDDKVAELIINKLKEKNFLNDLEFARWWIEQRVLVKPRAWRVVKMELRQKGISNDIIEGLNINSETEGENDLVSANKLAEKRFHRYKNLTRLETYQKLGRYLSTKGYSWEIIKKSIDEQFSK